jgi:hypothetical protein
MGCTGRNARWARVITFEGDGPTVPYPFRLCLSRIPDPFFVTAPLRCSEATSPQLQFPISLSRSWSSPSGSDWSLRWFAWLSRPVPRTVSTSPQPVCQDPVWCCPSQMALRSAWIAGPATPLPPKAKGPELRWHQTLLATISSRRSLHHVVRFARWTSNNDVKAAYGASVAGIWGRPFATTSPAC